MAPQTGDWGVPLQPQPGMIPAAYPSYRQEQQPQEPPESVVQMHPPQHQMAPGHAGLLHLQSSAAGVDPAAGQWGYANTGPQAPPQQPAQHLLPSLPHPQHHPWPPHPVLGQQAPYQQPPAYPQQAYQQVGDARPDVVQTNVSATNERGQFLMLMLMLCAACRLTTPGSSRR